MPHRHVARPEAREDGIITGPRTLCSAPPICLSARFRRRNPRLGQMHPLLGGRTPLKFVFSQNTSRHHLDKDPSERSHSHVGSVFQMQSVGTFVTRMHVPTPRQANETKARTSMLELARTQPPTTLLSREACEQEPNVESSCVYGYSIANTVRQVGCPTATTNLKKDWSRSSWLTVVSLRYTGAHCPG